MSDYEVHMPDGRSVSVSANTPEEAAAAARNFAAREKGAESGKAGGVDNFGRSLARGASFGFADEFAAAMDAAVGPHVDKLLGALGLGSSNTSTQADWSGRYGENLARERGQDAGYDEAHPAWSTAGKIVGGIGGTVATLPRAVLSAGASTLGNIAKGAAVGAGVGGVTGFGEGEGGLDNRLDSATTGAEQGAAAGGLLAPVAGVAGNVGRYMGETKLGQSVAENIVKPAKLRLAEALGASAPVKSLSAGGISEGGAPEGRSMLNRLGDKLAASVGDDIGPQARGAYQRIADAMTRGGGESRKVAGLQAGLSDLGPGAMPADAASQQVQRLARTAYISPGEGAETIKQAFAARNKGTGNRMVADIEGATGNTDRVYAQDKILRDERARGAGMNYGAANEQGLTVTPEMQKILEESPHLQRVLADLQAATTETGGEAMPLVEQMHKAKRELNTQATALYGRGSPRADMAGKLADRFELELYKGNPALESADLLFQQRSAPIEALQTGRKFMQQGTTDAADAVSVDALNDAIPKMLQPERRAFGVGQADTMKTRALSGPDKARVLAKDLANNQNIEQKLRMSLGDEGASRIIKRANTELKFADTNKTVTGGSDTTSKALSAMDDAASGGVPTSITGAIGAVVKKGVQAYRRGAAGNEDVRNRIAQILTDTNQTNAPEHMKRLAEALAQAGRARGVQRGAAAAAGGAGNQGL